MSTAVSLAPAPVFKAFDNNGLPLFNGQLFTFVAGSSTPQATYVDSTGTTTNTNPIILNSRGEANVWLAAGLTYKLVLQDSFGNQIWSVDQIPGGQALTAASIGALLYPQTPAELALGITPTNFQYPSGNVLRYGAKGDNATNDRVPIKTAFQVMIQQGGGVITLPWGASGIYYVNGLDAASATINVPQVQSDFSIAPQAYPVQFYIPGLKNTKVVFEGATIRSDFTGGGYLFAFDGCSVIHLEKPTFVGATVMTGNVPTVTGNSAIGIFSLTQNSSNISMRDFNGVSVYSAVDITGDPAGAFRVSDVSLLGNSVHNVGYYGFTFRDNGDQVFIENAYTHGTNRPVFIYGVADISGTVVADGLNGGFNALIKAYHRQTRNISLNMYFQNCYQQNPRIGFESQFNIANQASPQSVQNVYLKIDETNNLAFTTTLSATATSATLAVTPGSSSLVYAGATGVYPVTFSDGEVRQVTLTNGSASATWTGGLTNAVANVASGGGGQALYFSYFAGSGGTVLTSTSANLLWNNISLTGTLAGVLSTNVALNTNCQCQINVDGFFYTQPAAVSLPLTDLFNNNGYVSSCASSRIYLHLASTQQVLALLTGLKARTIT